MTLGTLQHFLTFTAHFNTFFITKPFYSVQMEVQFVISNPIIFYFPFLESYILSNFLSEYSFSKCALRQPRLSSEHNTSMENYIHVVFNSKLNIEQRVGYSRLLCPSVVTAGIKPIFQYEIFPAERLILLGLTFQFSIY